MKRHAFAMRLKPGMADEYRRRHAAIWPELVREHRDCGIHDYSIFFDAATDTLFAFCKLDDDGTFADMPEDDPFHIDRLARPALGGRCGQSPENEQAGANQYVA